ncbi:uncharacterized protein PV06_06095 [Exophiala oligosperma]|uniref:Cytochrome P450 n=1 Tax=Exophiala oligosperma TaxID=215243 RepID=A0A0D2DJF3_9EURO|nr:uncharacterized protein PV06_06095 [Exophiala oligosperma]KIW42555.1 hypothetical protein PV06_06095 [Exophiala oligosperma]
MCVFPEAQKKAYDELDEVIGHDRSPDWSDEACLPYIDPIIKETLRWRSVTIPGGIPHAPIQDDIYNGYRIPAGTNITANLWTIHRHSREFPDPDKFEPERYLTPKPASPSSISIISPRSKMVVVVDSSKGTAST